MATPLDPRFLRKTTHNALRTEGNLETVQAHNRTLTGEVECCTEGDYRRENVKLTAMIISLELKLKLSENRVRRLEQAIQGVGKQLLD